MIQGFRLQPNRFAATWRERTFRALQHTVCPYKQVHPIGESLGPLPFFLPQRGVGMP